MNYVTRLFSGVKWYYDGINGATLTGALDVIVIKQPDGTFNSSPFHVRFGKLNVLQSTEKVVEITVNGEVRDLHMKLGHNGEAFFVKEADETDDDPLPEWQAASPIQRDAGSVMEHGIAQMKRENMIPFPAPLHSQASFPGAFVSTIATDRRTSTTGLGTVGPTTSMYHSSAEVQICESDDDGTLDDDELNFDEDEPYWKYRVDECLSDSELVTPASHIPLEENSNLHWQWGNLPQQGGQPSDSEGEDSSYMKGMWDYIGRRKRKNTFSGAMAERQEGMYLDDIDPDDARTMSHYFGIQPEPGLRRNRKSPHLDEEDARQLAKNEAQFRRLDALSLEAPRYRTNSIVEHITESATSISAYTQTRNKNKRNKRTQTPHTDPISQLQLSFCGEFTDQFDQYLVTFDQIEHDRSILDNTNLIVRFDNEFFNWNDQRNNLLCAIAFSQCRNSLPFGLEEDVRDHSSTLNSTLDCGSDGETEDVLPGPRYKKTVRLGSEEIAQLGLKDGANHVTFSVTTSYQGTTECACTIYLWDYTDKILISDIDGTITRSDVFGHILPWVGKDWTQNDIAKLFTALQHNGLVRNVFDLFNVNPDVHDSKISKFLSPLRYKFLYLSSRAIGQASMTKSFLRTIKQNGLGIPEGPMLLSPDSLFRAMHAELVLRQPYIFKIQCLTDIKNLFPKHLSPFYSGFGNRFSDSKSYQAVDIPLQRIYIINHMGVIKTENSLVQQCTYGEIYNNIDQYFPPVKKGVPELEVEYLAQNFWKTDIQELTESDLEL